MAVILASIYGGGILIAVIGILRYRSRVKKSSIQNTGIKVENTGRPLSGGVDHLKIICK